MSNVKPHAVPTDETEATGAIGVTGSAERQRRRRARRKRGMAALSVELPIEALASWLTERGHLDRKLVPDRNAIASAFTRAVASIIGSTVTRDEDCSATGVKGLVLKFAKLRTELWPGTQEELWVPSIENQADRYLKYMSCKTLMALVEAALREHCRAGHPAPKSIGHIAREILADFGLMWPSSIAQTRSVLQ